MGDPNDLIYRLFADKFMVESFVSKGSQAYVFRAFDTILKRHVALKVILDRDRHHDQRVERLTREAIALGQMKDRAMPAVYEAGKDTTTGYHYVIQEWIPGAPLRNFLSFPMSEDQLLRIAADLASGLSAAHAEGILHRDLRPDNVIVGSDRNGRVTATVLDLGVAQFDDSYQMARLTAPDELMGSLSYVSPEQARGEDVTARTDVYSLGALLYEAICGRLPIEGNPVEIITAHLDGRRATLKPRPGFELSPVLQALVRRALENDATKRFKNCKEMFEVLEQIQRERSGNNPRTIHCVTVDSRARYVVVGRADGSIDVFDQETGQPRCRFSGHRGPVQALAFRPDTEEFISAGRDGHIFLWSIGEECRAGAWPALRGKEFTLAFSPFGYIFASGETNGRIRLWSLLEQGPLGEFEAHSGPVTALHFLPDGRFLASGGGDGAVKLWDIGSMELSAEANWDLGAVTHLAMHVQERFVLAFEDGSVAMGRWQNDAPNWHRQVHQGRISHLFEQHGGQGVFSVGLDGGIHCIDVYDGEPRRAPLQHMEGIRAAKLHPLSERLFASADSLLLRWGWGPNQEVELEGFLAEHGKTGWIQPGLNTLS